MTRPRFAFLALKEHPFAREMLAELLLGDFVPAVIIEEASDLADKERSKFLARIGDRPLAAPISEQARERRIELLEVPLHSSESLMERLAARALDLLVLGGTRIIRGPILSLPTHGVLNSHPGLLPECRGSASPAWSVYHDIPIGSSTHFCNKGVDTGDLLLRRELPVQRGMTYEDICFGTLRLAGVLMKETLVAWKENRWDALRRHQGPSPWPTFKNATPEVLKVVRRKLEDQTYGCYVD